MQTLIENGIAFIVSIQTWGDWLIAPMRFFSTLGNEEFFLLVLPLLYWSVDSALGLRVAFVLVTSNALKYVAKVLFAGPRPYWISKDVRALWTIETSFGIPSGHAQDAMAIWGMFAAYEKRKWLWAVCGAVIFLVGFSRMFLGVHFPHDVIFGWLLGAALLWAFVKLWDPAAAWIGKKTLGQQIWIAFLVSLGFIALAFGASALRSGFQTPDSWVLNSLHAGTEKPDPLEPSGTFTSAGTLFGMAAGAAWIMSMGGFQASGPMTKRALRYAIGMIGVLILWMGLGQVFPRNDDILSYALRYFRYALVGWWVAGGAPWIFVRLNLAGRLNSI